VRRKKEILGRTIHGSSLVSDELGGSQVISIRLFKGSDYSIPPRRARWLGRAVVGSLGVDPFDMFSGTLHEAAW